MLDTVTSIASFATENVYRVNPLDSNGFSAHLELLLCKVVKEKDIGLCDMMSGDNYHQLVESKNLTSFNTKYWFDSIISDFKKAVSEQREANYVFFQENGHHMHIATHYAFSQLNIPQLKNDWSAATEGIAIIDIDSFILYDVIEKLSSRKLGRVGKNVKKILSERLEVFFRFCQEMMKNTSIWI
jgi:hypothetical protein